MSAAFGEKDERDFVADGGDDALHIGERVVAVCRPGENAAPGVKQHDRLHARFNLRGQISGDGGSEFVEQLVQGARFVVEHGFGTGEIAAGSAFNHVGGERPRATAEADERHTPVQLVADEAHCIHDVAEFAFHVGDTECGHISSAFNGVVECRPLAGDEVQAESHCIRNGEDVGKKNGGVEAEAFQRLQRHLAGKLRCLAHRHKIAGLLTRGAVFGQIAPGLAHHPDGGAGDGFAFEDAEQQVVLHDFSLLWTDGNIV